MFVEKKSLPGWQLGAINGLVLGIVAEVFLRAVYEYERFQSGPSAGSEVIIDRTPYPFSWWYLPILSLVLVMAASVIGHRYSHLKSPILRWPVIGALAVVELYVITAAIDWWNASRSPLQADYWQFAHSNKLLPWILLLPAVLIFNLLFGWVVTTFSIGRRLK